MKVIVPAPDSVTVPGDEAQADPMIVCAAVPEGVTNPALVTAAAPDRSTAALTPAITRPAAIVMAAPARDTPPDPEGTTVPAVDALEVPVKVLEAFPLSVVDPAAEADEEPVNVTAVNGLMDNKMAALAPAVPIVTELAPVEPAAACGTYATDSVLNVLYEEFTAELLSDPSVAVVGLVRVEFAARAANPPTTILLAETGVIDVVPVVPLALTRPDTVTSIGTFRSVLNHPVIQPSTWLVSPVNDHDVPVSPPEPTMAEKT